MPLICNRCGAEAADGASFCSQCGTALDPLAGTERKLATLVFADLVGSTELASRLDPEELRRRLAAFFDVARATLAEYGGTVEKYVGDAVMAAFGVPVAHSDDPDRAIAASLVLVDRVRDLDDGLAIRIGVETGEVLATAGPGDLRVTGEAVNAAARLQQAASTGEVLVGERAGRASRRALFEAARQTAAKGFAAPLHAARAIAVGEPYREARPTPFVGREDDFELLRLAYRRAVRTRAPELVTITGEAGVGKTRLANELVEALRCEDPAPRVLLGRNPPYGRGIAFWALGEILRGAAGASADEPAAKVRAALERKLAGAGADDAEALAATLAAALADEGAQEDALRRAWRRMIGVLASDRPLIVGVDDAHWADESFLELLEQTVFQLGDVQLLVLCTARPELIERRPDFGRGARNVTQIELRPLASDATVELAAALLPQASTDLTERVAMVSGGNPFFAEEVARIFADGAEGANGSGEPLPDTVQAAITARLDLLPPDEKTAIQHAAVLGYEFPERALSYLLRDQAAELLERLANKSLVEERAALGPGRFGFRHYLIRDVAYSSLPKAERARLHELTAAGIEERARERFPELAELVAYHRTQAAELGPSTQRTEGAWAATVDAARIVARRGASTRAQHLFERASELAPDVRAQLAALRDAADIAIRRFRGDQALELLEREAAVADEAGDRAAAASALARAVELATRMGGVIGDVSEAEVGEMMRRGEALIDDADLVTRGRLVLDRAFIAWSFGPVEEMDGPLDEALEIARAAGDPGLISAALDAAAGRAWGKGRFRDSVQASHERLELLENEETSPELDREVADALHMMIATLLQTGDFRASAEWAQRAREADLAKGIVDTGWARELMPAYYLGEWDRVLEMAELVRAEWSARVLARAAFAPDMATPGAILGCRGDDAGAEEWFALAGALLPDGAERGAREGVAMLRAEIHLHHGRHVEAARATERPARKWSWWRATYLAIRAESQLLAGKRDAGAALAAAEEIAGDNAYALATLRRVGAIAADDPDELAAARDAFAAIGCVYQVARTGWLLGGEARGEAATTFERLRVPAPPD
jgi:class 3 adenylate cyclase/tetratricopeptide (TPR) repeat protein